MSKNRRLTTTLALLAENRQLTQEIEQLTQELNNQRAQHIEQLTQELSRQHTQHIAQINKLISDIGLGNELDYLQHTASTDSTKIGPFANKIKKKWLKAIQTMTGQATRTVTKADIGSEISIPPEERKWYSIQEEAPNRSLTNARYHVISQGLIVGTEVTEHAVVARTVDS